MAVTPTISRAFTGALLLLPMVLSCTKNPMPPNPAGCTEAVVLIHGLGRSSGNMEYLEEKFRTSGYCTVNDSYPSRKYGLSDLSEKYVPGMIGKVPEDIKKIHFVTHSLGGILLLKYLQNHNSSKYGRAVLIAPPGHGSRWANFLSEIPPAKKYFGPVLKDLKVSVGGPLITPGPEVESGVIAGNFSINPAGTLLLDGDDDGTVSVQSARLPGIKDFAVVKRSHTFIVKAPEVFLYSKMFIKTGGFSPEENE